MATKAGTKGQRKQALANHFNVKLSVMADCTDPNTFHVDGEPGEYLVLTDDEATARAREEIIDSLWAFKPEFILGHSKVKYKETDRLYQELVKTLRKIQGELCEDGGPLIEALLEDMDKFVKDAIAADGRGHFITSYDGDEHETKVGDQYFYIYRVN